MLEITTLDRDGLDELLAMGAAEGWNLGRGDSAAFWAQDSEGFVGARVDGRTVGGGSIVSYEGTYGFMGLFLLHASVRGRGLGRELWLTRRDRLTARLQAGAPIGMAAVAAMRPFYERGGFRADHLEVRFEWRARSSAAATATEGGCIVDARELPLTELARFDAQHFPAHRPRFLREWIAPPDRVALALVDAGSIEGLAVCRPAGHGHRVGPLFARDARAAEALLSEVERRLDGHTLALDVPETNPAARELVTRRAMREVFSCTRMHLGASPALPWGRIFGVTSFELG
jgi:GNAT superfamily N-acetyltransferase